MKTIKKLAEEYGVNYRTMWDRLTTLRRQLEQAGDSRANELIKRRRVTFGRGQLVVDDELLKRLLEEYE